IGYDFEVVIKSAKLLESEPVHFIIRGTGVLIDKIQEMVERYRPKNLEVRTNLLSIQELNNFMNQADIFLLPMNLTGFDAGLPTKVLEYQAIGKPIVCVSKGETANYISKTKSGLITTNKQPEKLAQLIMQLVADEYLTKTLRKNGINNIKDLTLEKIGARFMAIIMRYRR